MRRERVIRVFPGEKGRTCLRAFWLEPVSRFGSSMITALTQIHVRCPYRSALPPDLLSAGSPLVVSRLGDAFAGYVVPRASYQRIAPDACLGRLPLTEQWVPYFVVKQSGTMT